MSRQAAYHSDCSPTPKAGIRNWEHLLRGRGRDASCLAPLQRSGSRAVANRIPSSRPRPSWDPHRAFELRAVPFCSVGRGGIGALKKTHQGRLRIWRSAHGLIWQYEFSKFTAEECLLRPDRRGGEAVGRWVGVGIERRIVYGASSRPEPSAGDLVRIGLAHNSIRQVRYPARMLRGMAPGEPRDGEIETPPEEVNWARLAKERTAEVGKNVM